MHAAANVGPAAATQLFTRPSTAPLMRSALAVRSAYERSAPVSPWAQVLLPPRARKAVDNVASPVPLQAQLYCSRPGGNPHFTSTVEFAQRKVPRQFRTQIAGPSCKFWQPKVSLLTHGARLACSMSETAHEATIWFAARAHALRTRLQPRAVNDAL